MTVGAPASEGKPGQVIVVGLKFDAASRELLTWSLMKFANPGDRLIALHVLESPTGGGTASLLSLVNAFDSLLAVYEGFCNLKQVDLKLKVCRGASARKVLVKEAKSMGASKLILGTRKTKSSSFPKIRPSTSLPNYCARKLSNLSSVFAVNSGKIIFQRQPSPPVSDKPHKGSQTRLQTSQNMTSTQNLSNLMLGTVQVLEELIQTGGDVDNSLALVPVQTSEAVSNVNSATIKTSPRHKHGWSILQRLFVSKKRHTNKSHVKKNPIVRVLKVPSLNSSSVVYPHQKQSVVKENNFSNLEGENGAMVAIDGPQLPWSPISPSPASNGIPEELKCLHEKYSSSCRLFSYEELCLVTSNFMHENMVGKGGSSHVYRGCLPDGKELAVKILKPSRDLLKEFVAEIEIITTLHHKNIISLYGFCFEQNTLLLVYNFLSRGSLEENLHGVKKDNNTFGWQERYKVAVGIAEALDYLHNVCDQRVIHRDVKSSNILLSDDFEPQLSDFGLASWDSPSSSQMMCTDVAGTFGYLAPEYFMHGKVSDKVDVFAFGVVLLELLSGRMPITGESPKGLESLVIWAKPILEGSKVSELLDPHIGSEHGDDGIGRMVLAATLCIRHSPTLRPEINVVLKLLQGDKEATDWARKQVYEAEEVDNLEEEQETFPSNIQSHLNLALVDLEIDCDSVSSSEQSVSLEDYLEGRWSRTSSFN